MRSRSLALSLLALALLAGCAQAVPAAPTQAPAAAPAAPTAAPAPTAAAAPTRAAASSDLAGDLVIYSARKEDLMQPLLAAFQQRYPNVDVTLKSGAAGELGLLIEQEASSPRGDVFFTTDAAGMEQLHQKDLLAPYQSPNATTVPDEFKAADGAWTGVIGRSRNIMINTELVGAQEAPKSVFELTDPKWRGKLAMASIKEGGVRLWLSSLIQELGEEQASQYVEQLLANDIKVLANHTEVANAVARGEVAVGLLNHYYYVPKAREGAPVALIYPDQGPDEIGTLVTPLAVGIVKGAANQEMAKAFVDFVLSPEGQAPLTTQEHEFPLVEGAPLGDASAPGVLPIGQIKRPRTDFARLSQIEKRAVELFTPLLSG